MKQDHQLEEQLDIDLIVKSKEAIEKDVPVKFDSVISNVDRAVGAMLSSHVVKYRNGNNLKEDSIHINFKGSAGQSFGAFLANGITLTVEGDANDYVGKRTLWWPCHRLSSQRFNIFIQKMKLLQVMFVGMAPPVVNYISRVKWLSDSALETLA